MIDFSARPIEDASGTVTDIVVEGRDITNEEQQRQHMEVMQRVLRHNIRNDLTKVRGWTQVMAEEQDAQKRTEQFEIVERVLDKWDGMTEKMKDMRQLIDSQRGEQHTTELGSLVEDAVSPIRKTHTDLTIVTDLPDEQSTQVPPMLLEAVRELVKNAAEVSEGATVTVELGRSEGEWVEISVRDDGPGMPEMEAKVLETGEETALTHGGGLGLWMVRMVVTQAGGDVSVESTTDGTAVNLRVPAM